MNVRGYPLGTSCSSFHDITCYRARQVLRCHDVDYLQDIRSRCLAATGPGDTSVVDEGDTFASQHSLTAAGVAAACACQVSSDSGNGCCIWWLVTDLVYSL